MAIEVALDIQQPTLSQQLGILREAGIVTGRRLARRVYYRLADDRAARVVVTLRAIFDELLPASVMLLPADPAQDRGALAAAAALARLAERETM